MARVVSAREAVALIKDSDTVVSSGFVGCGVCEELLMALERQFVETGCPRDLTLVYAAGQGDGYCRGVNHLAHEGLVKRVIGGHWNLVPKLGRFAIDGKIEAYCLPQGVTAHVYRDTAAGRPTVTRVGLQTFADPRLDGGKLNDRTTEDIVTLVEIDGRTRLNYRRFTPSVALVRGTTADDSGNLSLEREAVTIDSLAAAQAAHNSGGIVIAQVERLSARGLDPRRVDVPGILVDYVVVSGVENHWQTFEVCYHPSFSGELSVHVGEAESVAFSERKAVCRRALMEMPKNATVNLGIGVPDAIAWIAAEEGLSNHMHLTVESGPVGGIPARNLSFGASRNPDAIISQQSMFDFYDGGGLDIAYLGMAQTDAEGNVNVSKCGGGGNARTLRTRTRQSDRFAESKI